MRIISSLAVVVLLPSLSGCLSYHPHEREDRVIEHRTGSYRAERHHGHGGYHRRPHYEYRHHRHHRPPPPAHCD